MAWAAPLFLLGLLAVALPFWLHRLQTQSSDRQPFSSAMLLETAEQRIHVKKKLKYLLLLAARVILLTLLAIAFARPFLSRPPDAVVATEAGTHLVLLDTSASMGRAGVPSQSQAQARRAINDAPADALLQVLTADAELGVIGGLTNDKAEAAALVSGIEGTSLRLDYGDAMDAVARFASAVPPPVTLHFISDYQASAMPVRFSDVVPAGVQTLVPHVVGTGQPFNWSVDYLREVAAGIDVGLNGFGDRERVGEIQLSLNGAPLEARGLSQTGRHSLGFELPLLEEGDNRVEARIETDDDFTADNSWYHVVDNTPPSPIPLITLNAGGLPVTYLGAALESSGSWQVETMIAGDFDPRVLTRYRFAIVDDLGALDPTLESALLEFVETGGNLLAFAGDRSAALEALPVTGHQIDNPDVGLAPGQFRTVGQIDTRHPALTRTEGWQSVSVTRHLPLVLTDDDEALVRLDDSSAFLVERRIGNGRVMLLSASLDNRWNDLPAKPVFVSFMIEAAGYLSGINDIEKTYTAGATLPLALVGSASGQVVDPNGDTVLSLADTTREQQIRLNVPGFYEVYTREGQTTVAVNIDPRESDLRRIDQDVLDQWQNAAVDAVPLAQAGYAGERDRTIDLWRYILLILAIVVIGESILGNMHLTLRRTERA